MKRMLVILGLILISLLSMGGCKIETGTSWGLSIEGSDFVKIEGTVDSMTRIIPRNSNVFKRGEKVNLVLLNVGKFKKGDDGLNWFDIDIEVKGPNGEVIFSQQNLLGEERGREEGHIDLPNNIATSPYIGFQTTPKMEPGNYRIKLTIHDRIGGGSASKSKTFVLE